MDRRRRAVSPDRALRERMLDRVAQDNAQEIVRPDPVERFLPPPAPRRGPERLRLVAIVVGLLLCHAGLLAIFFSEYGVDAQPAQEQEIAVEVVPEPPPSPPPAPPPEPPPKPEQKAPPPPPMDLKEARDAPRKANKETVEREAPDEATKTPNVAKPAAQSEAKAKPADQPTEAKATPDAPQGPTAEKSADDKPDAETLEPAKPEPNKLQRFASPEPAKKNGTSMPTFAQMLSNLEPIPDYKIAGKAAPSPVSGGTAHPNYLSILYGLIIPRLHAPRDVRADLQGVIVMYIDTTGNLLHLGVVSTSGSSALDNAALAAVRSAAPFPPPPKGLPPVQFTYSSKDR